ncbi:MAG: ribokinase [Chloroflexi bacterium]|nr:ribokinase [Chloroflexota bacterium]
MDTIKDDLFHWIPQLAGRKVLVVGDLFLDEYVLGQATRLSREAPIPVLEFVRRFFVPGGAANPAQNVCALGSRATAVGLVGPDEAGTQLLSELCQAGIDAAGVVVDDDRCTTTKTRIMAEGSLRFPQQLARIDRVDRRDLDGEVEGKLIARIQKLVSIVDAVLVSDYQTGVASQSVVQAVLSSARACGKLCAVDAQGAFCKYTGFDLIKGNRQEIEAFLNGPLRHEKDYRLAGEELLHRLSANAIVITRGADGLSVVGQGEGYCHLPAANRSEVFDVTGAGDTVIAVATLARVAGANALTAARLANYAAGWVVRKLGNAVVTPEELAWAVENW